MYGRRSYAQVPYDSFNAVVTSSPISATISQTLGALTLAATVGVEVHGALAQTLGALTLAATDSAEAHATLAQTFGVLTLTSAGAAEVHVLQGPTLGALLSAAPGAIEVHGAVSQTLGGLALAAMGSDLVFNTAVNVTLGTLTCGASVVFVSGAYDAFDEDAWQDNSGGFVQFDNRYWGAPSGASGAWTTKTAPTSSWVRPGAPQAPAGDDPLTT